jgi:Protein of unknown function (DUF3261)
MKQLFLASVLITLVAGCARLPFQETALVSLASEDPKNLVAHFQATAPEDYRLLSTVVFEYNGRKFAAISTVQIDRTDRVFKVAAMNPMGVKLFAFSGKQNQVTTQYAIADFSKYGDIAALVSRDIRRIYFDLIPSPHALVWKRKYRVSFRQLYDQGFLEYVFAGQEGDLIEKNYYDDSGIVWRVAYYEYSGQDGNRLPRGIVFTHYKYGYRLTVRHKEFGIERN